MNAWGLSACGIGGQRMDTAGHVGMGLIVASVRVFNLFPPASAH